MKISIAEVKRCLPVGKEVSFEYVGFPKNGVKSKRKVIKNSSYQLITTILDGPKTGESVYLDWNGVTADERDGDVYLKDTEEFVKIIGLKSE